MISLTISLVERMNSITIHLFFAYYNVGDFMKIIDVGDKFSYNNYHINGSVNIPYEELINNYRRYLNKKDIYYFTCKSGKLSRRAVAILSSLGYTAYLLKK